eukprot:6193247-Pleurochrysis_carterae.AAC.2
MAATSTPTLVWAQRYEKVFVTFEMIKCENVSVEFSEGLLSLEATANGKVYKLENMPLFSEIVTEESKWKNAILLATRPSKSLVFCAVSWDNSWSDASSP